MNRQTAILGGGCFWCLEACYTDVDGVLDVESGYCGGHTPNPSYEEVCAGRSGHAEVVRVTFDADRIGYDEVLDIFFSIHDPTTVDRQGNDIGPQYRSVIFAVDDEQAAAARAKVEKLSREGVFDAPIVTEVAPASRFHAAESYHQRYFERNPAQGYCMWVVAPKLAKFRKQFTARLRR